MTRAKSTGPTGSPAWWPHVVACAIAVVVVAGCGRGGPDQAHLNASPLDDAFFQALNSLRERAADEPAAGRKAAQANIEAMGRALVTGDPALDRLLGAQGRDPHAGRRFLKQAATLYGGDGPEAAGLMALARLWSRQAGNNLQPAVALALDDGPLGPGARLLLAQRLFDGLRAAVATKGQEGRVLLDRLPGWPVPISRDPNDAAFPHALRTLGILLLAGDGGRTVLAEAFYRLRVRAQDAFGGRIFALPVTLGSGTPVSAPWGARAGFLPLVTATVDDAGLHLGLRPALRWVGGFVEPVMRNAVFPGPVVAPLDALDAPPDEEAGVATAQALAALDRLAAPIEATLWPKSVGQGRAVFVLVSGALPAGRLRGALQRLALAGVEDFRFGIPGRPGAFIPTYAFRVPDGARTPEHRIRVVVDTDACAVFPAQPDDAHQPPGDWPHGARPVVLDGRFSHLAIAWSPAGGFAQRLTMALDLMETGSGDADVIDLVAASDDTPSRLLISAAFEIAGRGRGHNAGLEERFPGTGCPAREPCIGGIPFLFAGESGSGYVK